jgi:hypothetical protein
MSLDITRIYLVFYCSKSQVVYTSVQYLLICQSSSVKIVLVGISITSIMSRSICGPAKQKNKHPIFVHETKLGYDTMLNIRSLYAMYSIVLR